MMELEDFDKCAQLVAKGLSDEDKAVFWHKLKSRPTEVMRGYMIRLPSETYIEVRRDGEMTMLRARAHSTFCMGNNTDFDDCDEFADIPAEYRDYAMHRYAQALYDRAVGFSIHIGGYWYWYRDGACVGRVKLQPPRNL